MLRWQESRLGANIQDMSAAPDPFEQRRDQMFPRLRPDQIERIARHGTRQKLRKGEIVFEQGSYRAHFHVLIEGTIEVVRPHDGTEDTVVVHQPGEFTGETSLLTGRRSLTRGRAREDGEVTPGLASVAAPVLDHNGHPVAGVAVTFPAGDAEPADLAAAVSRTAVQLGRRLGGR